MRLHRLRIPALFALLTAAAMTTAHALSQQPAAPASDAPEKTEVPIPELAILEPFVGVWKVTEEHFDPATGRSLALVEGREEIVWALDRHAVQRRYSTSTAKATYRAEGTLTYNIFAGRYQGTWYDNASTAGPKAVSSEWRPDQRTMVHTLDVASKTGRDKFEVIERFVDELSREATTFQLAGDRVTRILEVRYKRTSACPSSATMRRIFGE